MGIGDLGNAFLIVLIFAMIQLFITVITSLAQFKKIWNAYKCNPAIMPFASLMGHDPASVFKECTEETQSSFMSIFLDPIYSSLQTFSETGNIFIGILDSLQIGLNDQQSESLNIVGDIGARVQVFSTNLNKTFITVADTVSKIGGFMTIIFYLLQTSVDIGKALDRDAPGHILRILGVLPR